MITSYLKGRSKPWPKIRFQGRLCSFRSCDTGLNLTRCQEFKVNFSSEKFPLKFLSIRRVQILRKQDLNCRCHLLDLFGFKLLLNLKVDRNLYNHNGFQFRPSWPHQRKTYHFLTGGGVHPGEDAV